MGKITASRTTLRPDPKHQSLLAGKFINCLMYDGKKSTAQRVFYDALDVIGSKVSDRPSIEVFEQLAARAGLNYELREVSAETSDAVAFEDGADIEDDHKVCLARQRHEQHPTLMLSKAEIRQQP